MNIELPLVLKGINNNLRYALKDTQDCPLGRKFYIVVSKIYTLAYRKYVILPIKLGKVSRGLEAEAIECKMIVTRPGIFI